MIRRIGDAIELETRIGHEHVTRLPFEAYVTVEHPSEIWDALRELLHVFRARTGVGDVVLTVEDDVERREAVYHFAGVSPCAC